MDHDATTPEPQSNRARWVRSGLVSAGLAVGLALTGLGVAVAQEAPSTDSTTPPAAEPAPAPRGPDGGGFGHKFGHGPHGFGKGAIHGEFTTARPNGGYQTIATQTGEVTSVNNSSIAVKSEDGYTRTYAVDENTLVNAGRDGIGDVKTGDTVYVTALVEDGKARAVRVDDMTNVDRLTEQWRPRPRMKPAPEAGNESAPSS